jgi:hypothetical protein
MRRYGRDFWIDAVALPDGLYWRVLHKGGGVRGATPEEIYMWSRLSSSKALPRRPRWYFDALAAMREEGGR